MQKLWPILCLALGGAAGAVSRYGLVVLIDRLHGSPWPWGTFAVNALGCLAFGLIFSAIDKHHPLGPLAMLTLLVGFCGAFTTFSSFAFDTVRLHTEAGLWHALANIALHNVLGLAMLALGLWLGARIGGSAPTPLL